MIYCMQFHNYLNYLLLTIIKPLVVSDSFRFVLWLKEHKCFVFFDFTIIKKTLTHLDLLIQLSCKSLQDWRPYSAFHNSKDVVVHSWIVGQYSIITQSIQKITIKADQEMYSWSSLNAWSTHKVVYMILYTSFLIFWIRKFARTTERAERAAEFDLLKACMKTLYVHEVVV